MKRMEACAAVAVLGWTLALGGCAAAPAPATEADDDAIGSALEGGLSQERSLDSLHAQNADEETCVFQIARQFTEATFTAPHTVDSHYGWRPGFTDARKYWFTLRDAGGAEAYTLTMRIARVGEWCHVDVRSINPLYVQDAGGEVVLRMRGEYSNSLFKALHTSFENALYAAFWVSTGVADALRPTPRPPSGRVGGGM